MKDEEVNLLAIYEPKIDKSKLADKIKKTLVLYESSSGADKDKMAKELIIYSKTLEEGFKVGFNGMTDLYDDKMDVEEELAETKKKLEKALTIIKREHASNPEIMKEFKEMNTIFVPTRGKRNYNNMIDQYILKPRKL